MAENSGRLREFKGVGANLTRGFGFGNFLADILELSGIWSGFLSAAQSQNISWTCADLEIKSPCNGFPRTFDGVAAPFPRAARPPPAGRNG